MPKGYTKEQTDIIKQDLLNKGRELFIKYGYKKIGVRELTKEVGIASGMFYKFFKSKDELFFTILNKEKEMMRIKIHKEMYKNKDNPKKALKSFYYIIIDELNSNPLTKSILHNNEYKNIIDKFSEDELTEEKELSISLYNDLIKHWQQNGLIMDTDLTLIIESLRSIVYLSFHKEEIGLARYDEITEFIIDKICTF